MNAQAIETPWSAQIKGGDRLVQFRAQNAWALMDSRYVYRYALGRWVAPLAGGGRVVWIMLNPSTADHRRDDATIRRCIGFTRAWGHAELIVVNLFAFRATNPRDLTLPRDPVGEHNDEVIEAAAASADLLVLAWGAGGALRGRSAGVRRMVAAYRPCILGLTNGNEPVHPLRLSKATRLRPAPEVM